MKGTRELSSPAEVACPCCHASSSRLIIASRSWAVEFCGDSERNNRKERLDGTSQAFSVHRSTSVAELLPSPPTEHHTTITVQQKEWFDLRLAISLTYSACKDRVKGAQDSVWCRHSTHILQAAPAEDLQSSQSRPTYAQKPKERRLGQQLGSQVHLDFPHSTDSQGS